MTSHSYSSSSTEPRYTSTDRADLARRAALIFGIAFLVVGVAGFIPGITQNLDDIEFAGHESRAELLGVFQVSVLHNLLHIAFGVAGLYLARRYSWARTYLLVGGAAYLLLLVYGVLVDEADDANFVPLNDADDWLHLGLGAAMVVLGLASTRRDLDSTRYDQR